jgi:predicted esterase
MLVEHGLDVTWVPFRGQHEIPEPALSAAEGFLKQVLGP